MRFADLEPPSKVKRVLKPVDDVSRTVESDPNNADIFLPHWVLDIYTNRPDELESGCLYDLVRWYEHQKNTVVRHTKPCMHATYARTYCKCRVIINIFTARQHSLLC